MQSKIFASFPLDFNFTLFLKFSNFGLQKSVLKFVDSIHLKHPSSLFLCLVYFKENLICMVLIPLCLTHLQGIL